MWNQTSLTHLLGIRYPIIQGPFGGKLSSVALTSCISNEGGLGSFGAQPYSPEEILKIIAEIRTHSTQPFAINLWVNDRDEALNTYGEKEYADLCALFKPYFDEMELELPPMSQQLGAGFEEQVQAVLEARPAVFSFVYGIPSEKILEECRRKKILTIGTATTLEEAIALEEAGVNAIVATGFEAGGHRVSFLRLAEDSLTGLFSLIPQVADQVSIPLIAAGGIADARGIRAAMALGADAVQIGTAFLATHLSGASALHKEKLFSAEARYTTLTKLFSGRLARGIRNKITEEMKAHEQKAAPYPLQGYFLSSLREKALSLGRAEYYNFWSGQSAPMLKIKDSQELFRKLVEEMG